MAKTWAYARVSSASQKLDRQIEQLRPYVVDDAFILCDKASGRDFERPQWQLLNKILDEGDTLVICSLDRLGRNYTQIRDVWKDLYDRRINVKILDLELLSTDHSKANNDPMQQMIANVAMELFSYIAERERHEIRRRQKQGIEAAKAKGKHVGRPAITFPPNWKDVYLRWKRHEISQNRACTELGISKNSFKKLLKKYEKSNRPPAEKQTTSTIMFDRDDEVEGANGEKGIQGRFDF